MTGSDTSAGTEHVRESQEHCIVGNPARTSGSVAGVTGPLWLTVTALGLLKKT